MPIFDILGKTPDFWRPLMGFMDEQGTVAIEPQFLPNPPALGHHFSPAGYAIVQRPGEPRHIVIDAQGETVLELPLNHQPIFSNPPDENGLFGVMHRVDAQNADLWKIEGRERFFTGETKHYAMRLDGTIAFEACILQSQDGLYKVSTGGGMSGKQGVMDRAGAYVIPPIYDAIYLSRPASYATVLTDGQTNVLRLDGSKVFARGFDIKGLTDLRHINDGLWVVPNPKTKRADVYDVASTDLIGHLPMTYWSPMIPRACPTLSGGVACIQHPKKGSTYCHPDGRPVMAGILGRPRWFDTDMRVGYFNDGRASFKLGDLWGYMDMAGKHVIPPQFKSDLPFRNGLAKVRYPADGTSWDRFSYVDRDGAVVWHQRDAA